MDAARVKKLRGVIAFRRKRLADDKYARELRQQRPPRE